MAKREKSDQVVRRVVLGREYEVYSMTFKGGKPEMVLLEALTADKRPSEKELVEKHKVDKVVILPTKIITGHYGVSIEKFMELAELIEKTEKSLSPEEQEESEETENNEQA